jgi:hypothetical protein
MYLNTRLGKKDHTIIEFMKKQKNKSLIIRMSLLIMIELFGNKKLDLEDTFNKKGIKGILKKIKIK